MPIYEFACEKCGKDSEILVRSSKWKGTKCPHCGSAKLNKKLSVFASATVTASSTTAPACCMSNGGGGGGGCCGGSCGHAH